MNEFMYKSTFNLQNGDLIIPRCDGYFMIKRNDGRIGLYKRNGDCIIPEREAMNYYIHRTQGIEVVTAEGNGFYSLEGKEIVPSNKGYMIKIKDACIIVSNFNEQEEKRNVGVYSYDGKLIVPVKFDEVVSVESSFDNKIIYIHVENKGYFGLYSGDGKEILPCEYKSISVQEEGISVQNKNGKFGILSHDGEWIIECNYNYPVSIYPFYEDDDEDEEDKTFLIADNGYGEKKLYDIYGNKILDFDFYDIDFRGGLISVCVVNEDTYKELVGVYSSEGKEIIPINFSNVQIRDEGIIVTTVANYEGFYSRDGREIVPCKYSEIKTERKAILGYFEGRKGEELIDVYDYNGNMISLESFEGVDCYDKFIVCSNYKDEGDNEEKIYSYDGKLIYDGNASEATKK